MAISAPHARSSATWLIAPAVAAPSRAAKRVPRWNSQMTPAVQAAITTAPSSEWVPN